MPPKKQRKAKKGGKKSKSHRGASKSKQGSGDDGPRGEGSAHDLGAEEDVPKESGSATGEGRSMLTLRRQFPRIDHVYLVPLPTRYDRRIPGRVPKTHAP